MTAFNSVLVREIPMVQKIIRDETWLEGERRGCPVPPLDAAVNENVCRIVLEVGGQMRDSAVRGVQPTLAARWAGRAMRAAFFWRFFGRHNRDDPGPSHE